MRKAIFWDFDGTLTISDHLWSRCLHQALGPLAGRLGIAREMLSAPLDKGFPWSPDGDPSLKGENWWPAMIPVFQQAYCQVGLPETQAAEAAKLVRAQVLRPEYYRVRPDAAATLAVCAYKGWKNYVLSNNFPELEEVLEALGLRRFFAGIVNSGQLGLCKPDERIFRKAELIAGFPSFIWMVGDNPTADIAGARQAGWHTAHIAKPGASSSGAEVTVSSLTELLKYL